jgi:hypothetical protein
MDNVSEERGGEVGEGRDIERVDASKQKAGGGLLTVREHEALVQAFEDVGQGQVAEVHRAAVVANEGILGRLKPGRVGRVRRVRRVLK